MLRRFLFLAFVSCLTSMASAGELKLTFQTTGRQDAGLAKLVSIANWQTCVNLKLPKGCTDKEAKEKNPQAKVFASTEDYVTAQVERALGEWAQQGETAEAELVKQEYLGATDEQRVLARAALTK